MKKLILCVIISILVLTLFSDQVTIYNDNFSLVRTSLKLKLEKGLQSYLMNDIPSTIEARSVIINTPDNNIEIFSQNYEYDLAGTAQILYKYIGKEIEIITKTDQVFTGILQFNDYSMIGMLHQTTQKLSLIQYNEIRNINLAKLPDNFFLKPTLHWKLKTDKAGKYDVDFSYLCNGMKWDVTYNSVWDEKNKQLLINSWVTITNETGKSFHDTKLKLIAGDVNKNENVFSTDVALQVERATFQKEAFQRTPEFEEKPFHDFHLYTLSENISINNKQTKQLRLFPSKAVIAKSKYEYKTHSKEVISNIEFINSKKNGLGLPLPKGSVKIYKQDMADDQLEFIGEDNIDHTAKDEKVTLTTGSAFDLVAKTTVSNSRKIANKVHEQDFEVILKNRSEDTKEITVIHDLNGNWVISQESVSYQKTNSNRIEFIKILTPGEEYKLSWTQRISY